MLKANLKDTIQCTLMEIQDFFINFFFSTFLWSRAGMGFLTYIWRNAQTNLFFSSIIWVELKWRIGSANTGTSRCRWLARVGRGRDEQIFTEAFLERAHPSLSLNANNGNGGRYRRLSRIRWFNYTDRLCIVLGFRSFFISFLEAQDVGCSTSYLLSYTLFACV